MKKVKQKFGTILMFSFVLLSKNFYAQLVPNIYWVKHYVSRYPIYNLFTIIDSNNNVYMRGYAFNGIYCDLIIFKRDSLDSLLWSNY